MVECFAAGLGQLTKLEYATTLPEADPDREWEGLTGRQLSNWTPKNLKVLQVALEHAGRGEDACDAQPWLEALALGRRVHRDLRTAAAVDAEVAPEARVGGRGRDAIDRRARQACDPSLESLQP